MAGSARNLLWKLFCLVNQLKSSGQTIETAANVPDRGSTWCQLIFCTQFLNLNHILSQKTLRSFWWLALQSINHFPSWSTSSAQKKVTCIKYNWHSPPCFVFLMLDAPLYTNANNPFAFWTQCAIYFQQERPICCYSKLNNGCTLSLATFFFPFEFFIFQN